MPALLETYDGDYDFAVVGAGPYGLLLACLLARWGYRIKQIDSRKNHTLVGRADGIQPRSYHLLCDLGLEPNLTLQEPNKVFEASIWNKSEKIGGGIERICTMPTCSSVVDTPYRYTTVLHQGCIEKVFISDLKKHGAKIDRPCDFKGFRLLPKGRIEISAQKKNSLVCQKFSAKYLIGADGAHSMVREQCGIKFLFREGQSQTWGVIDSKIETDFADSRMKCVIRSSQNAMLLIPREKLMTRIYVSLSLNEGFNRDVSPEQALQTIQKAASDAIWPHKIQWKRVDWYSVFPVRQGLAESFGDGKKIFLGGDSCHTHSPLNGQGMNIAFFDALNLAWKIHHVEKGFLSPRILETYESERREVAKQLLDLDAEYLSRYSDGELSHDQFISLFKENRGFNSGYGISYGSNILNWSSYHPLQRPSFIGAPKFPLVPGMYLPQINVLRIMDRKPCNLAQEIPINGSFQILILAGEPDSSSELVDQFAQEFSKHMWQAKLPKNALSTGMADEEGSTSPFWTFAVMYTTSRSRIDNLIGLCPKLSRYRQFMYLDATDCDPHSQKLHKPAIEKLGFGACKGGIVAIRPDGYICCVLRLDGSPSGSALGSYFEYLRCFE